MDERLPQNPFPGPQPYRAADRDHFYGRDAIVKKLANQILARSSTTLYGPSGAGKSSLMQAGVIPQLQESHDFLIVRVDGWPPGEAPLPWLIHALYNDLDLTALRGEAAGLEALDEAMALAERRSDQPILIYLDQLEQLLFPGRDEAEAEALIAGIERLARAPIQGLQIVLSLREDYLGRFRDRTRDRRELLAHSFRLGPLTVGEMVKSVCRSAARGAPPQRWDEDQIRSLMREVRTPGQSPSDEAEVQAAYAQIVCRALFQTRAANSNENEEISTRSIRRSLLPTEKTKAEGEEAPEIAEGSEAELILRHYLDATLEELGPLGADARLLLEDHLVSADGSRTLRTENELLRVVPSERLEPILRALERAAILHAEAHQGSRYFEIGHDWLARKVHEERQNRELKEEQRRREQEQRRREEEQAEALRRQHLEAEARLAKSRAQRRFLALVALASIALAAGAGALGVWALAQQRSAEEAGRAADEARRRAESAKKDADEKAIEASDARLLAGFRELKNRGRLAWGTKLLAEVQRPDEARGFVALASDALASSALEVTLQGHKRALTAAVFSHDGARIATASADRTARIYRTDGDGTPASLEGHEGPITSVAFSPDDTKVLTASEDGSARIWSVDGAGAPVKLSGHTGAVISAVWSPDGRRVATASIDGTARVWRADGGGAVELKGHTRPLASIAFFPDGDRVVTASADKTARVWRADGSGKPVVLKGHEGEVLFAAPSPDGRHIVTTSSDKTARLWDASGKGKPITLEGHEAAVLHAAFSPDGSRVATASADRTARLWRSDGKGDPIVFSGHNLAVTSVAFRPDGRYIATASRDQTARLWPSEGSSSITLVGHEAAVRSAVYSPDGARVLTVAAEEGGREGDLTAKVWRPRQLESLPRERRGFFHSAFIGANGELIASAYDDQTARVWRADGAGAPTPIQGHRAWVASAALSPDGARIVTSSFDRTARIVRLDGSGPPIVLEGHKAPVRASSFSPDGGSVVTASDDATAILWSSDGSGERTALTGHTDALTSAAWSPNGKRVVTTSLDHTARIWPIANEGSRVTLSGHGGAVFMAAWSSNGAQIVTASEDGAAQTWNAYTGAPITRLDVGGPVVFALFSPDDRRVAASSRKGGVRLFSLDNAEEPIDLDTPAPVIAMTFLDGGQRLFMIGADNTTRELTIDVGALKRGLAVANADCLPAEVRAIYLGESPATSRDRYDACERAHARAPLLKKENEE